MAAKQPSRPSVPNRGKPLSPKTQAPRTMTSSSARKPGGDTHKNGDSNNGSLNRGSGKGAH